MSEKSFTLLELHLGDGDIRIGPNTLLGGSDDAASDTPLDGGGAGAGTAPADGGETDDAGGCPGKSIGVALLLVGLLAAAGFAVARLLGDDLEDATELDGLAE